MRTIEPRRAAVLFGFGAKPDDGERRDAQEDGGGEEVLQEAQRVPAPDDRDVEIVLEQQPVGLDVDRQQDEEAPHREEVRQAGKRPLEQSALPEDLGDLRRDSLAGFIGVPGAGLPDVISLNSHRTRRAASAATTSVMPMPTTSLMSICVVTEGLPNALLIQPAMCLPA